MVLGVGGHRHAHTTQIRTSIAGHQGVPNPTYHTSEADQGLRVLPVGEVTVALEDGRLHVESWEEFSDGGYLVKPVTTGFLARFWDLIGGEVLCRGREVM